MGSLVEVSSIDHTSPGRSITGGERSSREGGPTGGYGATRIQFSGLTMPHCLGWGRECRSSVLGTDAVMIELDTIANLTK